MKKETRCKEIPDKMQCPCGSGKEYYKCCKKKKFKFVFENGKIKKQVPIHADLAPLLKEMKMKFEQYYGRKPDNDDFLVSFAPVYSNELLLQAVYLFRKIGVSEEKIYAYYKSDGLFPCDINMDLLPQKEFEKFNALCNDYNQAMRSPVGDSVNALQFVMLTTPVIEDNAGYIIDTTIDVLNDYIHRHSDSDTMLNYQMSTELDYCVFSALKTLKTLQSVKQLQEAHLTECIYALGRGIFENYMYMCTINKDSEFFYKQLLPKIDQTNYSFVTRPDGRINYKKVIKHSTGQVQNIHINISELAANLPNDTDKEIYRIFYATACQYVHVDVMSAKSYFSASDPYDEIPLFLIACLIIGLLSVLLLLEISSNSATKEQFRSDLNYLYQKNLQPKLSLCLSLAAGDPEHKNEILDLLLKRIS